MPVVLTGWCSQRDRWKCLLRTARGLGCSTGNGRSTTKLSNTALGILRAKRSLKDRLDSIKATRGLNQFRDRLRSS